MKKFVPILFLLGGWLLAESLPSKSAVPFSYKFSFIKKIKQSSGYGLVVKKSNFKLYVVDRSLRIIADFPIAIGMNPDGKKKMYQGDKRTPEGLYDIAEILKMNDATDKEGSEKLSSMNEIFFKAEEGFCRYDDPDRDLGSGIYGPRFFVISYPEKKDWRQFNVLKKTGKIPHTNGTSIGIGSGIAIHGTNDEDAIGKKSTNGCIAMNNSDVIKLDFYIKLKTPVLILP